MPSKKFEFSGEGAESGDIAIVLWDGWRYIRGDLLERDSTVRLKALNAAGNFRISSWNRGTSGGTTRGLRADIKA